MPGSALDTFRAQQAAVDAIHQRVQDVAVLLCRMNTSVDAFAKNAELKEMLMREETWLREAQKTVTEVSAWRAREARQLWPRIGRWIVAAVFAIASAAAAGAGYAGLTKPYQRQLDQLRDQAAVGWFVEQRTRTMSAAERRQFDTLMRWPHDPTLKHYEVK